MEHGSYSHKPVLLEQAVRALRLSPDAVAVDCTAGGGGHSAAIAQKLASGKLLAVDRDPQAIAELRKRFDGNARITVLHENFFATRALATALEAMGAHPPLANAVLADLGVSSHQLDHAARGFSFHKDAPLDMRMSMQGAGAADAVNTLDERSLREILYRYGEEKFAPRIVRAILREREKAPITGTLQLAEIIRNAVPAAARREGHPARQSFQALRIYVNNELDGLDAALDGLFSLLHPKGRLCVITFHSLEDRIVKQTFAKLCKGCDCPPDFPVCVCGKKPRGKLPCKPLSPGREELEQNPRSRSARLRVIEKI